MNLGIIFYYLLWPFVLVALFIFWTFKLTTWVMEVAIEHVRGLHDDVKNI
jgi:hypothetical protein